MDDDDAVAGEVDVELQAVGAGRQSAIERGNRVFRADLAAAAVREHEGPRRHESPDAPRDSSWDRIGHAIYFDDQDARRSAPRPRSIAGGVSAPIGEERSPGQPHRKAQAAARRCSPASSATTTPSFRSSSTPSCRVITSFCSACAVRRRAASCARSCRCSTSICRSSRAARFTTIRSRRSARRAACASPRNGDDTNIAWLPREERYVEKLATPDVTIADMLGDIDPDQGGAQRPAAVRRADDSLRAAAARQPRHLRHQRAARSRRQDSGRPVQHPAGRRHPD